MKVNKELLAKLRADRGAIVEGELARKRQKLGREAKDMDPRSSVDSGVIDHQGVAVFEMPRADKERSLRRRSTLPLFSLNLVARNH